MGGKSSGAQAPDPALIAAQIKSMGIQDTAISQMMENSSSMLPLQKEQLEFGLDTAKKGYDQTQEDRGWMLGRRDQLTGVQNTIVDDAKTFNTQDKEDELAGKAAADVNQGFASARDQNSRAMARMGVNPSSGKAEAIGNQTAIAQAAALSGGSNNARTSARIEGRSLTDRASNTLAGYPAMATASTNSGASIGTAGTGLTSAALTGMNSGLSSASTAAGGMGSNATGMFNAQANYQTASDQAAGASSAGLGSAIGGIAMAI